MNEGRALVTEKIMEAKVLQNIQWSDVAKKLNRSPVWTATACLGQASMDANEAKIVKEVFGLSNDDAKWLQQVPHRDGPDAIPSDPLLYRLHEALGVYGPGMKQVIEEEFGDGIMSAIDFSVDVSREPNVNGDRVKMVWSGKFLPYKKF